MSRGVVARLGPVAVLVLGAATVPAAGACGDAMTAAASADHLWLAVRSSGPEPRIELFHHAVAMDGPHVRSRIELTVEPEAMAAWGDRLWLVFPARADSSESGRMRRDVFSVQIRLDRALGTWALEPPDRLRAVASLPGAGRLAGLVGTVDGPVALMVPAQWADIDVRATGAAPDAAADADAGPDRPTLLVLRHDEWADVPLPVALDDATGRDRWRLAAAGDDGRQLTVLRQPAGLGRRCEVHVRDGGDRWTTSRQSLDLRRVLAVGRTGPQPVLVSRIPGDDRLRVEILRRRGRLWLADPTCPSLDWALLGLRDGLHLLSRDRSGRLARRRLDPVTGRIGIAETMTPPVPTANLWYLGVALLATVAVIVLLLIVRPGTRTPLSLPAGHRVLPASSRLMSLLMDLFPGGVLSMLVLGATPVDLLQVPLLATVPERTVPYLLMVAITMVHTTATELAGGRSLGKSLVGARVVGTDGRAPGAGRILLRNLLKLLTLVLPPLVVIAALNPNLRGLGDLAARTVVVADHDDAPDEPDNDR
ncbi:MAG: RDD family protein [Planctomycetota bacterium]|jgi:uncharacterized RDD family membrane protein YckC